MKECDCYHLRTKRRYGCHPITGQPTLYDVEVGICWGTKERDECYCGGDRAKCDFYPEVREKANKEDEIISGAPINRSYLSDWYINSVSTNDLPVWTEEHLEELFDDFYLIPKEE